MGGQIGIGLFQSVLALAELGIVMAFLAIVLMIWFCQGILSGVVRLVKYFTH